MELFWIHKSAEPRVFFQGGTWRKHLLSLAFTSHLLALDGHSLSSEASWVCEVTIRFLPWGGGGGGVTKVRPLLAKTTEVVPAAPQLEGRVRLLSLSSVKSLLVGVCCCQACGGGAPRKSRPAGCPLPFPFDLPYLHSSISSRPTLKLPARALLCTCVNAVVMGSGKSDGEPAEAEMWSLMRMMDLIMCGWVSDALMENCSLSQ